MLPPSQGWRPDSSQFTSDTATGKTFIPWLTWRPRWCSLGGCDQTSSVLKSLTCSLGIHVGLGKCWAWGGTFLFLTGNMARWKFTRLACSASLKAAPEPSCWCTFEIYREDLVWPEVAAVLKAFIDHLQCATFLHLQSSQFIRWHSQVKRQLHCSVMDAFMGEA